MNFNNAKEIRCSGGRVAVINPFDKHFTIKCQNVTSPDWIAFETWLSTQPEIHTSAPDGVYNVDEFDTVKYQVRFKNKNDHGTYKPWLDISKEDYENRIKNDIGIHWVETRQFIEHIGPKGQEREDVYWPDSGLVLTGKDAERFNEKINNPEKVSQEEINRIKSNAQRLKDIYVQPATHEQKGVEQGKEKVTVPISLIFKGQQLQLWNILDFRPRPTWVYAEIMERPTKDITNQLKQMAKRTGLVKFEITNNVKNWYK